MVPGMVSDGSDTAQMCPDKAIANHLHGFQMVPVMVPDGSNTVPMCPDEAIAYYLQGFQMVPGMVPTQLRCAQMKRLHTVCKDFRWFQRWFQRWFRRWFRSACAFVCGERHSVQNGTSRMCVLGGTSLRTPLYRGVRKLSTSHLKTQILGISWPSHGT